jgi:hypothetical protein
MGETSEIRTTIFEPFPDFGLRVRDEKVVDENEKSPRAVRTELVENLDEAATFKPIQNRGDLRSTHSGLLGEVALRATPLGAPEVSEQGQGEEKAPFVGGEPVPSGQGERGETIELDEGSSPVAEAAPHLLVRLLLPGPNGSFGVSISIPSKLLSGVDLR